MQSRTILVLSLSLTALTIIGLSFKALQGKFNARSKDAKIYLAFLCDFALYFFAALREKFNAD